LGRNRSKNFIILYRAELFFGKDETIVSFTITQKFTQELVSVGILGLVLMLMQIL